MNEINWKKKVEAFLHDPVNKMANIRGHKNLAKALLNVVGLEQNNNPRYDYIASAATRILFPQEATKIKRNSEQIRIGFDESKFFHPFSGKGLSEYDKVKEKIKNIDEESFISKLAKIEDYKKLAYRLWWEIPKISDYSYLILEDTRLTNQSIIDHLDISSAFATADEESNGYLILSVSIGPVQEFIAAGRKIRDLRSGSYLLSYLTFKGIQVISEKFGFDCIIFPDLRNNYLVKKYLENIDDFFKNNLEKFLMQPEVASLPNVFTAIIPYKEEYIDKNSEENIEFLIKSAIKKEIDNISKFIYDLIKNKKLKEYTFAKEIENDPELYWNRQVNIFPDIIVESVMFYIFGNEKLNKENWIFKEWEKFIGSKELENYYEQLSKLENTYSLSEANMYNFHTKILQAKSFLRKNTRNFKSLIEDFETPGDDLSGGLKSLVIYEKGDRKENLSSLSVIKREFYRYLKNIGLDEAGEGIRNTRPISYEDSEDEEENNKESIVKEYKLGVLLMDGDQMGKWITGDKIEDNLKSVHPKAIEFLEKQSSDYLDFLKKYKLINPTYQKSISRTLNKFSYFVPHIVREFEGELIYAGGDDVLAIFPANRVLEAANKIRKVYSGIGNVRVEVNKNDGKSEVYEFRNGFCYKDDLPLFNMMGEKATMSAGIVVCNPKLNLSLVLDEVRKAEKEAKNEGRNRFSLRTIRRSGKITNLVFEWDYLNKSKEVFDILDEVEFVYSLFEKNETKKDKSYNSFFRRLKAEYEKLEISNKEFIEQLIPYVLKRIKKIKGIEKVIEVLEKYVRILEENSKNFEKNNLGKFIDLLLEYEYIKRKVDKYE
ncbi:CRISPR-associated protein Cmr2 [Thermosipho japonicus]|uniref:CRISPR-associated protein Cmr2 n=1 Tax=Thermosipho japonicus TaxID=90323 RepID=A0A841GW55_9BACT|nr:type III-B CRISPR-associated protein Cas10/Cmr2 [Thermosipho japonicus]MBB6063461.1 CRISPR-associated protein Cmr2 [Thermosipho japonicus]